MISPKTKPNLFQLSPEFKKNLKEAVVPWGFIGLSEFTYYRTYARKNWETGLLETWPDCVIRVIEGMYSILKTHATLCNIPWNDDKGQRHSQEAAWRLFTFRWTPPGRGLWTMGTEFMWERGGACLNNPLHEDTRVFTKDVGWVRLKSLAQDGDCTILARSSNGAHGELGHKAVWAIAQISHVEEHPCLEIEFESPFGENYKVVSGENHRWWKKSTTKQSWSRVEATELKVGDYLPRTVPANGFELSATGDHKIKSITPVGTQRVMCLTVPEHENFTIEGFCTTSNCAFTSTNNLKEDLGKPFKFLMDMSMLGVGVGFDTRGAGQVNILEPQGEPETFVVPDSREGWGDLILKLINSYMIPGSTPILPDVSLVRGYGVPIKGFGGVASGPGSLVQGFYGIRDILRNRAQKADALIGSTDIVDIQNMIGKIVVAGNVRRCLPSGSLVHLRRGLVPVEQVVEGDEALTPEGYSKVLNYFSQGLQTLVRIKTEDGYFDCTPNHRMAVFRSLDTYEWVQASDLQPNDRLVAPLVPVEGQRTALPGFEYKLSVHATTVQKIVLPELDEELAWFIGVLHADGYVFTNRAQDGFNAYVSFVFDENEEEIAQKTCSQLERFGVRAFVTPRKGEKAWLVYATSKQLAWYLGVFKKPRTTIHIPDCILQSRVSIRMAYLAGVLDGDGAAKNRPVQGVSTVYPEWAREIQALYSSCGLQTRLCEGEDWPSREGWQRQHFVNLISTITKESVQDCAQLCKKLRIGSRSQNGNSYPFKWLTEVDPKTKRRYALYNQDMNSDAFAEAFGDRAWLPVKVENVYQLPGLHETFDIEVENRHEFYCQGYLTHNSAEIAFSSPDDKDFMEMKNWEKFGVEVGAKAPPEMWAESPEDAKEFETNWNNRSAIQAKYDNCEWAYKLGGWRWASNNSIFAEVGMDYTNAARSTGLNGEPGYAWLENMRRYGRMQDPANNRDYRVMGGNPCFVGDTLIAVADGRGAVPIRQLAAENKDVPVYSLDEKTGFVSIQWARNPRITRDMSDLVEVVLDNGGTVRVTPDHSMLLLDGTWKAAKDLLPGDSLPRFTKYSGRMSKDNPNLYLRINCDTQNTRKDKICEHRLIAKFYQPDVYSMLHDAGAQNGWLEGGLVVHHKDYNGLNNSPDNLEWMTFKEHCKFHRERDILGENNPMFGRQHNADTRAKIGAKTAERCQDPEYLEKLRASHTDAEKEATGIRMSRQRQEHNLAYYKEQEATTDLETVWVDGRLCAKKRCIICDTPMILSWRTRHGVFCSHACQNKHDGHKALRKAGQKTAFEAKQRQTLHDQMMIFKDLAESLGRDPKQNEWAALCKERGVSYRINPSSQNPHALKSFNDLKEQALAYNHRVKEVRLLSHQEPVYNLTVDNNYTVGVVTLFNKDMSCDGIFVKQCLEQSLESYELCCLVESFPVVHTDYWDYQRTLKFAYLYAKTVTLVATHWAETNSVMLRNRRIGCSQSGILEAFAKFGRRRVLSEFCDQGYKYLERIDRKYSEWLAVRESIKKTSVKPSGTVSLLAGRLPGIHGAEAHSYYRTVRVAMDSALLPTLRAAGYKIEPSATDSLRTAVVYFPVLHTKDVPIKTDMTIWEQFKNAADYQRWWADNQVSITVTFKTSEIGEIAKCLAAHETELKGISLLPLTDHGYRQAPYIPAPREEIEAYAASLRPLDFKHLTIEGENVSGTMYCDGDSCAVK